MLLTITTTYQPATDLGFLLHKHPARVQTFDTTAGQAHVFYPEATEQTCTAALLLEIDPIELVTARMFGRGKPHTLAHYVNDRPYAASSLLSVAISKVFGTALSGRCDQRPDLVDRPIPLRLRLPALPCQGGPGMAERMFGPLGWDVAAHALPLDPAIPEWGESRYVDVTLTGEMRLAEALNHIYVLLPVLDNVKHYWVSTDEVDKLVRAGQGWLATHPDRALITRRYLAHRRSLVTTAIHRLAELDDAMPEALDTAVPEEGTTDEDERDPTPSLAELRRNSVVAGLRAARAARVVDLGCGEGTLLKALLADSAFSELVGVDVSARALDLAHRRLRLSDLPDRQRDRIRLIHSSLTYRDDRLMGYDAIVLMEVIEHVDPPRLTALEHTVFDHARPATAIVTTPNAEYNSRFEFLHPGDLRHADHRFEWDRAQFRSWCGRVAKIHGYGVRYLAIGAEDPDLGPPSQMAVFTRRERDRGAA